MKGENMNKEFNQTEYVNDFIRKKYDRINLLIPAGNKEIIKSRAVQMKCFEQLFYMGKNTIQ